MSDTIKLSEKEFQLLSAYLDDVLTERERTMVNSLLASRPEAVRSLENLRNLKSLLRLLPVRKVPHHYTLTHIEARAAKPGWVVRGLRVLSGFCAAALAVVLAFDLLIPIDAASSFVMLESAPMEAASAAQSKVAPADEDSQPPIFSFQAQPRGMGMGGGGDAMAVVPDQPPGLILPDISINLGEQVPQEDAPVASAEETSEMAADEVQTDHGEDTGPILGVQSDDLRGQIIADESTAQVSRSIANNLPARLSYPVLELALLVSSLLSGLSAILIWRKKRANR